MKSLMLFYIIILSSCSSMHIPYVANTPLLEEKGEVQIEAGVSTNSVLFFSNYAFSDKYAISFGGSSSFKNYSNKYDIFTPEDDYTSGDFFTFIDKGEFAHNFAEIGIGRYNMHRILKLEAFGGLGYGSVYDTRYENRKYKIDYYQPFVQVNIGKTKKIIDYGASIRIATSMFNYDYNLPSEAIDNYTGEPQSTSFSLINFVPSVFFRLGPEKARFVIRTGFSLKSMLKHVDEDFTQRGVLSEGRINSTAFHVSMGVKFKFNFIQKDKS